jgi:hypothetical protein
MATDLDNRLTQSCLSGCIEKRPGFSSREPAFDQLRLCPSSLEIHWPRVPGSQRRVTRRAQVEHTPSRFLALQRTGRLKRRKG